MLTAQNWEWVSTGKSFGGGPIGNRGEQIAVDNNGNSYCKGSFNVNMILGTDTFGGDNPTGDNTYFIAKYTAEGSFDTLAGIYRNPWGDVIGPAGMATSPSGNLYIGGGVNGSYSLDTAHLAGLGHAYIAKFYPNMRCVWAHSLGEGAQEGGYNNVRKIHVDKEENIYVVGVFNTPTLTLDTFTLQNSTGEQLMFVAKLDSNGQFIWVKQSPTINIDFNNNFDFKYSNGHLLLNLALDSCLIYDTASLCVAQDSARATVVLYIDAADGSLKRYIAASGAGTYLAMNRYFGLDSIGNLYCSGQIEDTININGQTFTTGNTNGGSDFYLAKFDIAGSLLWLKQYTATESMYGSKVMCSPDGRFYASGRLKGSTLFGSDTISSNGSSSFYARFDAEGNAIGITFLPEGAVYRGPEQDLEGNVYFTGYIPTNTSVSFGSHNVSAASHTRLFLAKLGGITTGISNKVEENNLLNIFANPSMGNFTVQVPTALTGSRARLQIADMNGRLVKDEKVEIGNAQLRVDMGEVSKGTYTVVLSNSKKNYTGRVVIK